MGRSTVHYADNTTNNILKKLHKLFRPAGTPVQRVEYIIELLLLRIFNVKLKHDDDFKELRKLFTDQNEDLLFSSLGQVSNELLLETINNRFFPFYANIMSQAKKVCTGNLGQKMLDQLVLIEEVFKNSNFTNNVKSGNIHEIIGLIGELDEERLLKTDLLGDAIESALSETGGTKDIGLYRTPDHIRQFMVSLVAPSYSDNIFDPACGTGGFLFDSFGYVLEGTSHNGMWPGEKAHPEMHSYLTKYLHNNPVKMPSFNKSMEFYRSGLHGIEYLGMIRKMAAINFYIRGLNPANIEQGDSLAMFSHEYKERFSVVLANPPFGAERDKDSYSNVWEEFPREAETTILFVKLMLDALAPGGRCAVVVSEGFLSWDQTSARNLRRLLLEQTNLKAIISLPQGIFVSKGGVGPKTSILYFEKGTPTKDVWFYRVKNDGYSMGTNRRTIEGCQLIEAMDIFHKYIKNGKTPPETDHSFLIPASWILSLDPRIKQRIVDETTQEYLRKNESEIKALKKKLNSQLKEKVIDQIEYQERIQQHDEIWRSKMANEVAKRIEKVHTYSFNLPSYRSNLSSSQIIAWNNAFSEKQQMAEKSLGDRYVSLQNSTLENAHINLGVLNIQNALEYDIARQYLMGFHEEELLKHDGLLQLRRIMESGAKYPRALLSNLIMPKNVRIKKNEYDGSVEIVEKISFAEGKISIRELFETGMDLLIADRGDLIVSKINIHQGAVAISPRKLACSTHYQVFGVKSIDCIPEYIYFILRSPAFLNLLIEQKNKGIKNEQGSEFVLGFEIPLPHPDEQIRIVKLLSRIAETISSCRALRKNHVLYIPEIMDAEYLPIGNAIIETKNGWSPNCDGGDLPVLSLSCLKFGEIDIEERKYTSFSRDDLDAFIIQEGDFFYSRGNTPELVALAGISGSVHEKIVFPDLLTRVRFDLNKMRPQYAVLLFNSVLGRSYFGQVPLGASPSMVKVSQSYMKEFPVPFIGKLSIQDDLIAKYYPVLKTQRSLDLVENAAQRAMNDILDSIWR